MRRRMAIGLAMIAISSVAGEAAAKAAKVCPQIYRPVCAVKHHEAKTYPNESCAKVDGAKVITGGPCLGRRI